MRRDWELIRLLLSRIKALLAERSIDLSVDAVLVAARAAPGLVRGIS